MSTPGGVKTGPVEQTQNLPAGFPSKIDLLIILAFIVITVFWWVFLAGVVIKIITSKLIGSLVN